MAVRFSPALKRLLIRRLYALMSEMDRDGDMTCMNYGYTPLEGEMEAPGLHEEQRRCSETREATEGSISQAKAKSPQGFMDERDRKFRARPGEDSAAPHLFP